MPIVRIRRSRDRCATATRFAPSILPGRIRVTGEIRAGEPSTQIVEDGECIEIMTGAPVPDRS